MKFRFVVNFGCLGHGRWSCTYRYINMEQSSGVCRSDEEGRDTISIDSSDDGEAGGKGTVVQPGISTPLQDVGHETCHET